MRSTPGIDERLRERLRQAVETFADGNTDKFGRMIKYQNGGYIRQCLDENSGRKVRSSLISRIHAVEEMAGWFDGYITQVMMADVAAVPVTTVAWPFERITRRAWEALPERVRGAAEDAAIRTIQRIQEESAPPRKRRAS